MDLYECFTNLSPDIINGRSCAGDTQLQLGRAGLQCWLLSNYRGKDIWKYIFYVDIYMVNINFIGMLFSASTSTPPAWSCRPPPSTRSSPGTGRFPSTAMFSSGHSTTGPSPCRTERGDCSNTDTSLKCASMHSIFQLCMAGQCA